MDFSNLAFAGDDPAAAPALLGERLYNTHVKNGIVAADGSWCFQALDTGLTDYPAVLSSLRSLGYDGHLTVECLQPEAAERPVATARRDRDILLELLEEAA